jgi:L-threonylcarbamoyladenylate synthase
MIVLPFDAPDRVHTALPAVTRHLHAGGILGYPTETVYGVGCTLEPAALERLAAIKRAESGKPFLLLVTGTAMLRGLRWTPAAAALATRFWPGPLTLVVPAEPGAFPPQVTSAEEAVAVRDTPHAGIRALIDALGAPITSTSANPPGSPPALDAAGALAALRALGAPDDSVVLDGGALPASASSTLVDCTGPLPRLLRAGAIDIDRIREVVEVSDG